VTLLRPLARERAIRVRLSQLSLVLSPIIEWARELIHINAANAKTGIRGNSAFLQPLIPLFLISLGVTHLVTILAWLRPPLPSAAE
jgi:hypothetical protein